MKIDAGLSQIFPNFETLYLGLQLTIGGAENATRPHPMIPWPPHSQLLEKNSGSRAT